MSEGAKTVLVVDDEPDAREYLETVLQDNGFTVRTARDGTEAVAALEAAIPDLVTLDITMPEKSGVSVYRTLKEDDRFKGIPVIIITGMADDFQKFISTRRQVPPPDGYMPKPVEAEPFMAMVNKLLG